MKKIILKKSKACMYWLALITLASCTKESSMVPVSPLAAQYASANAESIGGTGAEYGLLSADKTVSETQQQIVKADIRLVRAQVMFSQTTSSKFVDQYLKDGFHVQINYNYMPTNTPVPFPTDTVMIRQQAEKFFSYYQPSKSQIPVVVVENEWDNETYRDWTKATIQHYLTELRIITEVGHKYGFKIADAGITSTYLQRWMYSQLTGTAAFQWKLDYFVGLNNDYDAVIKAVSTYIDGVKKINIDYSNVHWYNTRTCSNGFGLASQTFMKACGKTAVITNEFGIKANSAKLFEQTVNEIRNSAVFALAYSGVNDPGKAIRLTDEMLSFF